MRRVLYDVPLWSLYLHRRARGLPRADPSDAVECKLQDELFERLYAGEAEPIPEAQRFPPLASWAQRIHDTIAQLPAFERLAQDCRGRADEAAMAVEALMNELKPDEADDVLRRSIRAGCGKAVEVVEQLRDALDGLEHVGFGTSPLGTPGTGEPARAPFRAKRGATAGTHHWASRSTGSPCAAQRASPYTSSSRSTVRSQPNVAACSTAPLASSARRSASSRSDPSSRAHCAGS